MYQITIEKYLSQKYDIVFDNDIQTNGSLLDNSWCEFLNKYNFNVEISYDGFDDLNGHVQVAKKCTRNIFKNSIIDATKWYGCWCS